MDQKAGSVIKRIVLFALVCIHVNLYSQDASSLRKLAEARYNEGKYNEGLELAVKAIEIDSKQADNYYLKGMLELKLLTDDEAEKSFSSAIDIDPNDARYYLGRGVAKQNMNLLFYAIEDYSQAISYDPENKEAYGNRGTAKLLMKEYESAIPDFTKAIELLGNRSEFLTKRGRCYQKLGKDSMAYLDLNEALKLDAKNLDALSFRGKLNFDNGKYEDALGDFNSYLAIKENARIFDSKGAVLDRLNKIKESEVALRKAIKLDPKQKSSHYALAHILADHNKNFKEALKELNKAILLDSTSVEYFEFRAEIEDKIGFYEFAAKDYAKAISLAPNNPLNYVWKASSEISGGNYQDAIADSEAAVKQGSCSSAYINLGVVQLEIGNFKVAGDYFKEASRLSLHEKDLKNQALAHINLASALIEDSKYESAIQECDSAILIFPKRPSAFNNRGVAYHHLNKYDSAFKDFSRALKIESRNIYAHLWRGKTYSKTGNTEKANLDLKKVIQLCDSALQINPRDAYNIYYRGQAYEELGNFKKAFSDYTKAHDLRKENYFFNKALRELEEKRKKK